MPIKKTDYTKVAVLYVRGPDSCKGDIITSAAMAGVKVDPADPLLREAITKEGGVYVPPEIEPPVKLADLKTVVAEAKTEDEWKKLADRLKPTIDGIADGTVKATTSQAALIRHILDRAFGRVVQAQTEKRAAAGIVILPTLGFRDTMDTCPQCGFAYPKNKVEE